MVLSEQVLYKNESYRLFLYENEHIFHPSEVGITSIWPSTEETYYESTIKIEKLNLILDSFAVRSTAVCPYVNGCAPVFLEEQGEMRTALYKNVNIELNYSGAIIIVKDFIDKYGFEDNYPCYCYKKVLELIFNEGCLITTIDHSRAMLKIRKNIDVGLRNPKVRKDSRCINRFIKSSFIGEYWSKNTTELKSSKTKTKKLTRFRSFLFRKKVEDKIG